MVVFGLETFPGSFLRVSVDSAAGPSGGFTVLIGIDFIEFFKFSFCVLTCYITRTIYNKSGPYEIV